MERKTKINAEDGRQDLVITREFDLPLELLFKAYEEPEIVAQWMGTKVLKLENKSLAVISLKQPIPREMWYFRPMEQSMTLFRTKRSSVHLKWAMCLLMCNLNSWNLKHLPATPASSPCISSIVPKRIGQSS